MNREEIKTVKARIDLVTLIKGYTDLEISGSSFKGRCPLHTSETLSFFVFPKERTWRCFACGTGGDAIAFVMRMRKVTLQQAVAVLLHS